MRSILVFAIGLLATSISISIPVPSEALTPAHQWSKRLGSIIGYASAEAVAVDGQGNIAVVGFFVGTTNLGGADLVSRLDYDYYPRTDIFVVKYNSHGTHQWSQSFGSAGNDSCLAVAFDGSGNLLIAGAFSDTISVGGPDLFSQGHRDIFMAKFDPNGVHQWSRAFGGASNDVATGIATDAAGNVALTGWFNGVVDFGGGNLFSNGSSGVNWGDIFVAKYNSAGVYVWARGFGSPGDDAGNGVAFDASGNVVVTGQFVDSVNFGAGALGGLYPSVFLGKYSSSTGNYQWAKSFGSTGSTVYGSKLALDSSGNIFVTGQYFGNVNLGGSTFSASDEDVFLGKFNSSGTHQWSQSFGGANKERAGGIAVNASSVVLTGFFGQTVNFGGGPLTALYSDVFLAKYNQSGVHQWSTSFGSGSSCRGRGLALDASSNVVLMGSYVGTLNLGGDDLSAGNSFLARFSDSGLPYISSIADIGNDQGRRVKIRFGASYFDEAGSPNPIIKYEAYRRDDPPPAAAALTRNPQNMSPRELQDNGWTFAGEVPAHQKSSYGIDVSTIGDSTLTLGQYLSTFFIRAATVSPAPYYDSPIDAGYSLDNLAPGIPGSFAFASGALTWSKSSAEDFDYFAVYGSNVDSFGSATLVNYTTGTHMNVSGSSYTYYYVTATDFSGNEGKAAKVNALSGVGETPRSYVLSVSAYPNPFNPRTIIRYTLPAKGRVAVQVFDARGSRVATLIDTSKSAGSYTVDWNGLDDHEQVVGSGVYFVRLVSQSGTRSYKITLLK